MVCYTFLRESLAEVPIWSGFLLRFASGLRESEF